MAADRTPISPDQYIRQHNITSYNSKTNQVISNEKGKYFSAKVFKKIIENDPTNTELHKLVQNELAHKILLDKKLTNTILIINMGLGWDDRDYKNQPEYVQNFINEIKTLGLETIFLERFAYGPIENNIEIIKPQLTKFLKSGKDIIFLSLCKGTPELLISLAEITRDNPELKKPIKGYLNMSGMLGGTFFSKDRLDLNLIQKYDPYIEIGLGPNPKSIDRFLSINALHYMTNKRVQKNLERVGDFQMPELPVINVTGVITSDFMIKKGTPLKMFLTYNNNTKLYPYANDGFLEVSHTLFSKEIFPKERTLLLESTHLLADGNFEQFDLADKKTRIEFYHALFQALIN